jgi:hypothetical protein
MFKAIELNGSPPPTAGASNSIPLPALYNDRLVAISPRERANREARHD